IPPVNQGSASTEQDVPASNQNEPVSIRSDDEIYMININSVFNPGSSANSRGGPLEKIPKAPPSTSFALRGKNQFRSRMILSTSPPEVRAMQASAFRSINSK
ncbi:hypothetical protein FACUT_13796, partial [Fusarium acutatum]